MKTMSVLSAAMVLIGVAAMSGDAVAGEASKSVVRVVHYGDLDLHHEAGVAALYHRMKLASRSVCRDIIGRDPMQAFVRRDCTRDTLADAVERLDDNRVSAYHSQRARRMDLQTIASR